jgi:hypothetical protein
MAQEFRYPLTRICIRSGSLTLPLTMLSVFPDTGDITAVDTTDGSEFPLDVTGRRVGGLADYFRAHALEVNDEVVIRPLEDGRFGITAQKRDRRPDYGRPDVLRRLLDDVVAATPATESEIRALHPDLPGDFPLRRTLESEPRLVLHEGRWQSRLVVESQLRAAEAEAQRRHDEARRRAEAAEREEAQRRTEAVEREAAERPAAERSTAAKRAQQERDHLNDRGADASRGGAQRERHDRAVRPYDDGTDEDLLRGSEERFDWDQPISRPFRFPWQRHRTPKETPAEQPPSSETYPKLDRLGDPRPTPVPRSGPSVVPAPRSGLFPGDSSLPSESLPVDPAKTKRAREAFAGFGYRIEGLAHGQLMLHADLGRRQYRTLLHVLPDGERLDWAALLARRRDSNAKYLAVVGDHRDLHRLTAPADLARATLWSWAGVDRVRDLATTTMIGPLDLEPHFERDGMFEYGLERFERTIAKRVQERGTLSAVLTALAGMRAPAVFVLEDLAAFGDLPRDQLVRVLERLSEAPFHLVSRVDSGEFCLRYRVHDALDQLGTYALSLRARLPDRQRERLRGLPEGVEPIGVHDLPEGPAAGERGRQAERSRAVVPVPVRPAAQAPDRPLASASRRAEASDAEERASSHGRGAAAEERGGSPGRGGSAEERAGPHGHGGAADEHEGRRERSALFSGAGWGEDEDDDDIDVSAAARRGSASKRR